MNKWLIVGLTDVFVLLVAVAAIGPEGGELIGASILVLVSMTLILVYGVPFLRVEVSREISSSIALFVPYAALLLTGASGLTELPVFLLWYLFPTVLFLAAGRAKDSYLSFLLTMVAAGFLWIGFDHRYTRDLFMNYKDSYVYNSLWMAAVGLSSYSAGILTDHGFDKGIAPTKKGSVVANVVTPLASLVVIPFGLVTGFLVWNPDITVSNVVIGFIGIYLTISIQEEMIFRGMILKQLDGITQEGDPSQSLVANLLPLLTVSALFAATHWNNETPQYVWHYFFAAFVAGLGYGVAYRKGGMFAAILSHTLVDWIWALLLKRV